ncbi:MAG: hypothetical protein PHZ26_02030 [Candidatus Gracilibacteria bacterium]|nr:hypothetical protein [Candidatus Gracilibacteria bacterium]MDD2908513.1 hypothetical protein [Candidatus Gracilibacteria bacterium]
MKNIKKIIAGASVLSLLVMSTSFAATFTGTITGGQNTSVDINSTWDGTSTPTGTTASGSDTVLVTAQVTPTLTMNISSGAIAFGTLNPGTPKTESLNLTTATNAELGITIGMDSNGLESATKYIGTYGATASSGATTDLTDFYKVDSITNSGGTTPLSTPTDVAANQTILTTSNVFQSNAITAVNLTALAGAQTEAGNYGDTLTFTVTGNF